MKFQTDLFGLIFLLFFNIIGAYSFFKFLIDKADNFITFRRK